MSTNDDFFRADGPADIGFRTRTIDESGLPQDIKYGVFVLGNRVGVCGRTDSAAEVRASLFAGVVGTSSNNPGVYGICGQEASLPSASAGVIGTSQRRMGVSGSSDEELGVFGQSDANIGVFGTSNNRVGVFGEANTSGPPFRDPNRPDVKLPPAGVWGTAQDAIGVAGTSSNSIGVLGQSAAVPRLLREPGNAGVVGVSILQDGVEGVSNSESGVTGVSNSGWGVFGVSNAPNPGVYGFADAAFGVMGESPKDVGVLGVSGKPGPGLPSLPTPFSKFDAGVWGTSQNNIGTVGVSTALPGVVGFSTNDAGVVGQSANPMSFGGYFFGNVHMTGTLTSDSVKGAVVPFPDGTKRLLICMESPEAWFEDFGAARLKRGRAMVKLDADFARVIKLDDYRVFLTPEGDCQGLYVRSKTGKSFEVRELQGGTSSIAFSYRVVGKRKDIKNHRRFAKIDTSLPVPPRAVRGRKAERSLERSLLAALDKRTGKQATKRA